MWAIVKNVSMPNFKTPKINNEKIVVAIVLVVLALAVAGGITAAVLLTKKERFGTDPTPIPGKIDQIKLVTNNANDPTYPWSAQLYDNSQGNGNKWVLTTIGKYDFTKTKGTQSYSYIPLNTISLVKLAPKTQILLWEYTNFSGKNIQFWNNSDKDPRIIKLSDIMYSNSGTDSPNKT